jgi:hypothetical protein
MPTDETPVAETLSHSDTGVGPDRGATTGISRGQKVVGVVGVLVVLWVGNDTYKVIDGDFGGGGGGGNHGGPSQDTPVEKEDQEPGTDGGGEHQPPAGGHG